MIYTIKKHHSKREGQFYYSLNPQGCILIFSYSTPIFFCPGDQFIRKDSKYLIFEKGVKITASIHYEGKCAITAGKIHRMLVGLDS